ncbi:MAG TPA: hypothetical protein VJ783_00555 [Pirellulales bacterium]|nr:hypothetical protein [Pirellulales bacterium]
MVPAFAAVAAFYDAHRALKVVLIVAQFLLAVLYVVVFLVTAIKWLPDARACLRIREKFYTNNQKLLFKDPFEPLRALTNDDYASRVRDRYHWFLFSVTLLAAGLAVGFMLLT